MPAAFDIVLLSMCVCESLQMVWISAGLAKIMMGELSAQDCGWIMWSWRDAGFILFFTRQPHYAEVLITITPAG